MFIALLCSACALAPWFGAPAPASAPTPSLQPALQVAQVADIAEGPQRLASTIRVLNRTINIDIDIGRDMMPGPNRRPSPSSMQVRLSTADARGLPADTTVIRTRVVQGRLRWSPMLTPPPAFCPDNRTAMFAANGGPLFDVQSTASVELTVRSGGRLYRVVQRAVPVTGAY